MTRLRLVLVPLVVAGMAFGIAACGDDDETTGAGGTDVSDASFDLQIGGLLPLTGDLSAFGPAGEKAANLAVDEANAALEEAGADITVALESADSQTEPTAAQSAAKQLISGGASCLIGPWSSGETVPVGRSVAAREQVPLISPSATSPELTELPDDGYVFRTAPSDALQGQVLADAIEEAEGTDVVVSIGGRNDPYGEGIVTEFQAAWEAKGGTVTGPVLWDPELSSYNSEADEIVSENPDQFLLIDFEEPWNRIGPALTRTGDYDAANLWTADGLAFEDGIPDSIPVESLAGASGTRPSTPADSDTAKAFDELYASSSEQPKGRNSFDSQNFDAAVLCTLAAVAAGSSDAPAIQEQVQAVSGPPGDQYDYTQLADAITALQAGEDIDYEGVSGPGDLDDNGDPTLGFYETYEYDDQGKFSVTGTVEKESGE
jgi:ABC-type branched-subunit amino acid transport system substrate-binding protein